ncbi:MAG TPA: glycosyltransferase [Planctomycetaceae bacterium]|nr:glycosyltransferase [Planctomycetaceae bacterium]
MTTALCEAPPSHTKTTPTPSRPLKVCHVSLTLKTGGLERILADLARHHSPERCEPTFLALREIGRFGEEIRAAGRTVAVLQNQSRFGGVREMARFFRDHQFDVVHTHNTYPHIYGTLAARWAGVPVVVQTRHGQRAGHGWKSSLQYRWAAKWTDRIITVSDDAAGLCVTTDRIPAAKVTRIWNGIDLSEFRFAGPSRDLVAIAVARLSAEKDFPTLLRAMALAVLHLPALRLKIVGDGPERAKLESLTDELQLRDNVEFLGERRDVPKLLTQAGFFVTSSLTEGISLTLLEAMAVGLPVVATSVGGNPEIVVDGKTGRLAPAADPAALAGAIIALCDAKAEWAAMGRAGCERAAEHFDIHRMARDYEELYETLIEKRRRSARSKSSAK